MKKVLSLFVILFFTVSIFALTENNNNKVNKSETVKVEKDKKAKYKPNLGNGKKVYNKICFACHNTGVAGAASIKDKKRWKENAELGFKKLFDLAIKGNPKGKYGVMPAKGGCADCSDNDIKDAVHYMTKEAGVKPKK